MIKNCELNGTKDDRKGELEIGWTVVSNFSNVEV